MAPSAPVASTTTRLGPSRSLTDVLSETAGRGARSSTRETSAPLTVTTICLTPRPLVTTPASGTVSRSTRTWSLGLEMLTASGAVADGGVAGAATDGGGAAADEGGVAGAVGLAATLGAGGAGLVVAGGAGVVGAGAGAGVAAGGGVWATAVPEPAASKVSRSLLDVALTNRCTSGAYQSVTSNVICRARSLWSRGELAPAPRPGRSAPRE